MTSKILKGEVISTKMQKTVVVAVHMPKRHKLYEKVFIKTRKFKARDEIGVNEGDMVVIQECKPFSKEVTWKVVEKVDSGKDK